MWLILFINKAGAITRLVFSIKINLYSFISGGVKQLNGVKTVRNQTQLPMLIMVMGFPLSGKTYFSKVFSNRIGGIHINSDKVRKELHQRPAYDSKNKLVVYQTMFSTVCQYLDKVKRWLWMPRFPDRNIEHLILILSKKTMSVFVSYKLKPTDIP